MNIGILKATVADFIVSEAMVLPSNSLGKFYHYVLKKAGYTTFEAINSIATDLNFNASDIGYAGLKDEDGITTQNISIPVKIDNTLLNQFNSNHKVNKDKFIMLIYMDSGIAPLQIGNLCGNNFRLIIRKLDKAFAHSLAKLKKHQAFFINYYGPQRFGLPNAKKNTHLIGKNLINEDYKQAMKLLGMQPNEIGQKAKNYKGNAKSFFNEIDARQVAFYQSSLYSHQWNELLKDQINKISSDGISSYTQEDINYLFLPNLNIKLNLIAVNTHMEYTRITPKNGKLEKTALSRPILIQTNIMCNAVFEDTIYPDYWACELMFFLPTGCYATIAIPQFLQDLQHKSKSY